MVETATQTKTDDADSLEAERALGRWFSVLLPAGTALVAIAVGSVASIGPGILVLAAGALLGAIALLWSSLRTLAGDAALPEELERVDGIPLREDPRQARKKELLRALKDLAHDHAVGKIDDEDYEDLAARYREQAKAVMREIDAAGTPAREKAEKLAREHLAKVGLIEGASDDDLAATAKDAKEATGAKAEKAPKTGKKRRAAESQKTLEEASRATVIEANESAAELAAVAVVAIAARQTCATCGTSNESDATFCKKCGSGLAATAAEIPEAAESAS